MNKTKIEWADYIWNPIKGLCPAGCWYCYARRMYQRFKMNPDIRLDLDELQAPFPKKPSRIFVCSTFELFHPLADPYRDNVFRHIKLVSEHTFIVLTKMPERIDRPMPDNVWLGVSIIGVEDWYRILDLARNKARIKFVSLEPFIGTRPNIIAPLEFDLLIIGRLTGRGCKHDPSRHDIQKIVDDCREHKIAVFLKNNLSGIWPGRLIQEFPR